MRRAVALALALAVLVGCGGDDGGSSADQALVDLLREETGQTESIATCIAERVDEDERVDRDELESIVRGDGTTDVETADAYGDAALACAQEELGDLGDLPGVPDDLTDQIDPAG